MLLRIFYITAIVMNMVQAIETGQQNNLILAIVIVACYLHAWPVFKEKIPTDK